MIPEKEKMEKAFKERHGEMLQKKFSTATVAICGLGGLGSNIALCLARAGVGKLLLFDFDRVDISNLHRQQYKAAQVGMYKTDALAEILREINPYICVQSHTVKLDENNLQEFLKDAQVVCEAFDLAENKAMLVNGVLETMPEKFLVAASGMAGFDSPNLIKTRQITPHFYLCGDEQNEVSQNLGLFSSRVMCCAAHEAHMALQLLAGLPYSEN